MYVTDTTEYTVIRLVGNDTRPLVDRFDSHQEAYDFAKAQTNETTYIVDTLSYRQLRAEIVNMNTQLQHFRNNELVAVGLGAGAAACSFAGLAMSVKGNQYGSGMYVCAGVLGVVSLVWYIEGYAGLKLNRLEVTPDGMVIMMFAWRKAVMSLKRRPV